MAYEDAFSDPDDPGKAAAMLDAGYAYAHTICTAFFDSLADSNQRLNFSRDSTAIFGGFVSAVLGFTGTAPEHIALVSTGFAATLAGMESYQEHLLFGPDVNTVRRLVAGGQARYDETVTPTTVRVNLSFSEAVTHITNYQSLCQVDSIRTFVNDAVGNQEIVFDTGARDRLRRDFANQPALDYFAGQVSGLETVNLAQFSVLYYMAEQGIPSDTEIVDGVLRPVLGPNVYSAFVTPGTDGSPATLNNSVVILSAARNAMRMLQNDTADQVYSAVSALREEIDSLVASKSAAPGRSNFNQAEQQRLSELLRSVQSTGRTRNSVDPEPRVVAAGGR